jgi:hypothetical protein
MDWSATMGVNVTKRFQTAEVDPDELEYIVFGYFGRGSNGGTRKPRYFKDGNEESYIEFEYGNHNNLLKITAQPGVKEADLIAIQEIVVKYGCQVGRFAA